MKTLLIGWMFFAGYTLGYAGLLIYRSVRHV